jgi:O-phosphoseryl-tRNA synthetase
LGLWNSKKVVRSAEKDFERAWLETADLLPKKRMERPRPEFPPPGRPHILFETIQRLRQAYLGLGFNEVVNPLLLEDKEIRRQFGPEAMAVLDRCYYLAGLPRPDVGLSQEKKRRLEKLGLPADALPKLQEVLHRYKKGDFGGDELASEISGALGVHHALTSRILKEVFPEFRALEPEATRLTLRSHMTSGWFLTLQRLIERRPLPIRLFSVDRCFRREQTEDATHLRTHHSASCVLADGEAGVDDGKAVAEGLLTPFGFEEYRFQPDEKQSKYYAPGTQTEVYARHPTIGWVEVATFGVYSPVALSRYRIEVPVMNLGLGVERLAMVLGGYEDVREMVYPQFYGPWTLSDREIASMVRPARSPKTSQGAALVRRVVEAAEEHREAEGPCSFLVYSGEFLGAVVSVRIREKEAGKRLVGPAAFNELFVLDGNLLGLPPGEAREVREKGVSCSLRYIDGIAALLAAKLEEAIREEKERVGVRAAVAKTLTDINLALEPPAKRYITAHSKTIDVRGPIFVCLEAEIQRAED